MGFLFVSCWRSYVIFCGSFFGFVCSTESDFSFSGKKGERNLRFILLSFLDLKEQIFMLLIVKKDQPFVGVDAPLLGYIYKLRGFCVYLLKL